MWWLLACACPTFADLEVSDLTEDGDPTALARVTDAVHDFAAWTQREGVCVGEVDVVDSIPAPDGLEVENFRPVGLFTSSEDRVQIVPSFFPLTETVNHELCHALDVQEGFSEARPDLFDGEEIREDAYPTEERRRAESFSLACEPGGIDVSLELAYEEQCGLGPLDDLLDPIERFVAADVFPGASRLDVVDEPVALNRREVFLDVGVRGQIVSVTGTPTDLYALVQTPSPRTPQAIGLTLVRLDPDTGEARARQALDLPLGRWFGALLPGDESPVLVVWNGDWPAGRVRVYSVEGDALVPLALTFDAPWILGIDGAVSDGVLVVTVYTQRRVVTGEWFLFGGVRAFDLTTGQEHPLAFPEETWGLSVWAEGFLPGPEGLEMMTSDGFARLDPETDTWSLEPGPPTAGGLLRLGEKRLHVAPLAGYEYVVHDLVEDTWAFVEGACSTAEGLELGAAYAQVGDRAFVVPASYDTDGVTAWELSLD